MVRIMVVEDDADFADRVAETLRMLGHEVVATGNAPRALALLETFAPDLVLVDIVLPVFDGNVVAAEIRAYFPSIRVIAMTAWKERANPQLFDGFLGKPFSAIELARALDPTTGEPQ